MYKKWLIFLYLSLFVLPLFFCGCAGRDTAGGTIVSGYLRNNVHTQYDKGDNEYRASYANWTNPGERHVIIPVNTPVTARVSDEDLVIATKETPSRTIIMEFDDRNMNMKIDEYVNVITSPQPTSLDNLSAIDREGIQEGRALPGMTKEGVRIALGYPAAHKTYSLESNLWVYWENRWDYFAVMFDENDKVKTAKIVREQSHKK